MIKILTAIVALNSVLLLLILKSNRKIMADLQAALDKAQQLSDKVDTLQSTIDAEQQQIADLLATNAQVVSDLTAQRDALQAIIDAGGSTADFQPVIDAMDATIAKVEAASSDVESTT